MSTLHWSFKIIILLFMIAIFSFSYYAVEIEGKRLNRELESRQIQLQNLEEENLDLITEIFMLKVEIEALKSDSEESSLAARTLLGMVQSMESVYQLNATQVSD
jgi:cell division protein FtsB